MSAENNISFELPMKTQADMIKVIGVGGGGGNAINYMFDQKINGVDFVICNTDLQALADSPVPNKIQLGADPLGTGAGGNPEKGAQAARESGEAVKQMLGGDTKMVFVTAGMGGGTGTGAAPIIASIAREMGLLVVGIVTSPFKIEGKKRLIRAQKGIEELRRNVDSLIVINNDKLREVYGNLGITAGYSKADEVLSIAAKGIAEVITNHYKQNIDFQDAKTVLENSGTAIMGAANESGDDRAKKAIVSALDSPLLNDNKIKGAKNVLLLIVSGKNEITFDEAHEITEYIQDEAGHEAEIFLGYGQDDSLEDGIALTVVATGFAVDQQNTITNTEVKKIVHTLEGNQKATYDFEENTIVKAPAIDMPLTQKKEEPVVFSLTDEVTTGQRTDLIPTTEIIKDIDIVYDEVEMEGVLDEDFIINSVTKVEQRIEEEQEPIQQNLFDLPLSKKEEPIKKEEHNRIDTNAIYEKRYVLEDPELESTLPIQKRVSVIKEDEDLMFEIKTESTSLQNINNIDNSKEFSPLDYTVAELQKTTGERLQKLKQFNHRFTSLVNDNSDVYDEPAYKRQGLDVEVNSSLSKERTTLRRDGDGLKLSNNSYLHDNVD